MDRRSDPIELTLHIHRETEFAIEVSLEGSPARADWLAKCLIDIDGPVRPGLTHRITLPRGLAHTKGLL